MGFFWPYYHQNSMPIPIPSKPRRLEKMPQQLEITFSAEMIMTFIRFYQKIFSTVLLPTYFSSFFNGRFGYVYGLHGLMDMQFSVHRPATATFSNIQYNGRSKTMCVYASQKSRKKSSFSSSQIGSPLGLLFHE